MGLRWRALRRWALYCGTVFDARHDVKHHTSRTRVDYLAQCLPDVVLHQAGAEAQEEFHTQALERFLTPDAAARLADAVASDTTADVHVTACSSSGNDPDRPELPCSLGLAACFTCPNGYRTRDHVPGLLGLVAYTEVIRDHDPEEWLTGDAAALHHYATRTLERFPSHLVEAARSTIRLGEEMTVIHGLYHEFRRQERTT